LTPGDSSQTLRSGMQPKKRILVYHIGTLGDTIVSVPALRVIRRTYGDGADIYMLSDFGGTELVQASEVLRGTGLVDHFLDYRRANGRFQKLVGGIEAWWNIVRHRFDAVVYLMQSERSARAVKRDKLFFGLCGIRKRLAFEAFTREFLYPRDANGVPQVVEHEALRRAKRLQRAGFDALREGELDEPFLRAPEADQENAKAWLAKNRRFPEKILAGFCPGTKMTAKVWPTDRVAEIGRRLLADGRFEIVIVGGPADVNLAETLIQEWGAGLNAAGSFSVMGSAAVLHQCKFVFAVDSGPMHMAAVGGIPCVALFSSVDYPGRFSPLGRNHVMFRHAVPCAACRLQVCPVEGHPCMTGITTEEVWQGVKELCGSLDLQLT
jgi:heptosyltransferase III